MSGAIARDFIQQLSQNNPHAAAPGVSAAVDQLKNLYEKRLWHQLTITLENFVNLPYFQTTKDEKLMVQLYERFIKDFESKMNQLKFVKIILAISTHISNPGECVNFLQRLSERVNPDAEKEAHALLVAEIALSKLTKLNLVDESKTHIDKVGGILEKVAGADPTVYSSYYKYLALYNKVKVVPTEFYKNSLMYLVYTPLETLPAAEQQTLAFDMGIAALVAPETYNFGELLAHPILKSLQGTPREWLLHFLFAFNSGDIARFEKFLQTNKADIDSTQYLNANLILLRQKICILALMELVFNRPAEGRTLPFKLVAEATKIPVEEVELLVMKALSLKLIKGVIDEVNQTVSISWVQPRVLDVGQVAKMRDRVQTWIDRTNQVLSFVEGSTAPELLA